MITSFKDYEEKYFAPENDLCSYDFLDDLSAEEIQLLKNEITTWTDKELSAGHSVLTDYYDMKISDSFLKELCLEDLNLAFEIYTEGIGDTCQRELLIDALLKKINMRSWPINGEGDKKFEDFLKELKRVAPQFGIEMS